MTTNYDIDNVDLDESPYNFSSYINVSDGNYTNANVLDITARKTVIFGQNALTYSPIFASSAQSTIGRLGNAFNAVRNINIPKIDIDEVSVLAVMPQAVVFSDTKKSQYYIRGNFVLAENNPNIVATLEGLTNRYVPQYIGGNLAGDTGVWKNIAAKGVRRFAIAIQSNGTLWSWGSNFFGQLGLGNNTSRSNPTQIGNLSDWTQIAVGSYDAMAIRTNGTLWAWGGNVNGELGLNDFTARSVPVQVGTLSVWTQITIGNQDFAIAIQSNGTLWSWGVNPLGYLGLGDTTNRSTPVQVGALSVWTKIFSGTSHTLAIQSNGTLWSWGYNISGQLGLSDTDTRSSPVQVGSLLWKEISVGENHNLAIQSNGTLWSWGLNSFGQLGLNTLTIYSSPVQVGTLSVWTKLGPGRFHSLAIQSDGTLWAWGNNSLGQLGLSDLTHRSSPVQVGTSSLWTRLASTDSSYAIQSDGSLWAWGRGNDGEIGDFVIFNNPQKPIYGL